MTDPADLAQFLLARYAEDEEAARAVIASYSSSEFGVWELYDEPEEDCPEVCVFPERGGSTTVALTYRNAQGPLVAAHIARHDPARVLAEVDAWRRIVQLAQDKEDPEAAYGWEEGHMSGQHEMAQDVLSLLALPYAAHPAFRQEWKP